MLFNSYQFIFVFLPLVLAGFFVLGTASRSWALRWLILSSLVFYAWWRPYNVLLIAPSIVINFLLARILENLAKEGTKVRLSRFVLLCGIAFNVGFLGYFKYKNFFLGGLNDAFGTTFVLTHIVLPLGISFITFQKIAFLIDVHAGRIESFTLQEYCLFVLFFPQLIAGPIVHFREMMPQFKKVHCRFDSANVTVGLTLFVFGLFKKVVLADGVALMVSSIYGRADAGEIISIWPSWIAAIGFTLQVYFDFSGYSDMAIGLARMFGIRLPANFDSPLRATSIIDFWLRWHMTLTRFLTAYIYTPLVLALTRRRLARGRPALNARNVTLGSFMALLVFPTMLTMLVSGFWHGAGYLFLLWGALHGIYLSINHAWRFVAPAVWKDKNAYPHLKIVAGFLLTFTAVTAAMVFFRSGTLTTASGIFSGMIGMNGIGLPKFLFDHAGPLVGLLGGKAIFLETLWTFKELMIGTAWIVLLLFIALACPNTMQLLARHDPALGLNPRPADAVVRFGAMQWNASLMWAVATAVIVAIAVARLAGPSEFLYWQF